MKKLLLFFILLTLAIPTFAQNEKNPMADFVVGTSAHPTYKIFSGIKLMTPDEVKSHGLIPVMMCTVDGKCSGHTPAEVRAQGITPIVLCQAKTFCQGATVNQMESAGLVPSIICDQKGGCGGINFTEVRKQGLNPIILCQSLNDCKIMKFKDKIQYVKPCTTLTTCGY